MLVRALLTLLWALHFLPRPILAMLGALAGILFMILGRERRRVVDTNLELCFPLKSKSDLRKLRKKHFVSLGKAIAESTIAWWGSKRRIRKLASIEGKNFLDDALRQAPVIVLAPHFIGVEILAIRLSMEENAQSMYSQQKNPVFNNFLKSRRTRFKDIRLVSRQDGIKEVVRSLKARLPLFFLPDMDFGSKDSIFVPFFGVEAATIDAVPRLASLTKAKIIPVTIRRDQKTNKYIIQFTPAWGNYPSGDLRADTRNMNEFIEECILASPEQYYWVHKRFKTRPIGEEPVYG